MKVLHLVAGNLGGGGAARGAYWLHQGLIENGIESKILTNSYDTLADPSVISITDTKKEMVIDILRSQMDKLPVVIYPKRDKVTFSTSFVGYDFTKHRLYGWADIIHLHWINKGFVNVKSLSKVKKPIIWTMRDMWPMTGGCHYSMGCQKYQTGCGECDQLKSKHSIDLSRLVLKRKKNQIPKNITMVGISNWLSGCARKSEIFKNTRIETISNNINTDYFFPIKKSVARSILGLPQRKYIILAGATNLKDYYKGFNKYIKAMQKIKLSNIHSLFFGNLGNEEISAINKLNIDYTNLGYLSDTVSLRLAYSAADVFVAPSLMDAFGKTLAESMACGTPVVCFDATGPRDIVDHLANGYRAIPFESASLADGINWIYNYPDPQELSQRSRQKVISDFDAKEIAKKYIKLYNEALNY